MRANRFRFAAGLYFEKYKRHEQPLKDAIVSAMRGQLVDNIASSRLQEEAMLEKFQFHTPTTTDAVLAQELTTDDSLIGQYETFNRAKADLIQLDLVGWAFPMDEVELHKTINNFGNGSI